VNRASWSRRFAVDLQTAAWFDAGMKSWEFAAAAPSRSAGSSAWSWGADCRLTRVFRSPRAVPGSRGGVAQVSNLPYRRLPVGKLYLPGRIGGLEIRDTADWKSALRLPVGETREIYGLDAALRTATRSGGSVGWRGA